MINHATQQATLDAPTETLECHAEKAGFCNIELGEPICAQVYPGNCMMHDLGTAWRETDAPNPPSSDDGYWVHTTKREFEVLEALGLSMPPAKPEPKRVGRPRIRPEFVGPKRPRGRPRKVKDITDATQD